ncbi:MAG: choice-of-anchor Q domain-containing protein, partial [Tepidisphaeraceae bacterium]
LGIFGPGSDLLTVRRDSGGDYRILWIPFHHVVSISGMTLANGRTPGLDGGCIFTNGTLEVRDCVISGNAARFGGGIANQGGGVLTVSNCTFSGNIALTRDGGAIDNFGATATLSYCTFANNFARFGGGVLNDLNSTLSINNCTFSGNTATTDGGGLDNFRNSGVTITSSTFAGNSAEGNGGAIRNGSGCWVYGYNSTIADNDAATGGGVSNEDGGSINGTNCIVALNSAYTDPDVSGSFNDWGYNFIGGDPMLGPLADNGGPTETMALLSGSLCINTGDPNFTGDLDQRGPGYPRMGGWVVDIGAFEYQGFSESLIVTTEGDEDNGTSDAAYGSGTSLREAMRYAGVHDGPDTVTFALGAGAHTINLSGPFASVNTDIDIQGPGVNLLTVRRDTGGDYGIFTFDYGTSSVSGMTISNSAGYYGALYNYAATLSVSNCRFTENSGYYAGAIYNEYYGTLSVTNSLFDGNTAVYQGAGIHNNSNGTLTVTDCIFSGNNAAEGGGIYNYQGTLDVSRCTFDDKGVASQGGAIYSAYGITNVIDSTISNCTAASQGGGIYAYSGTLSISGTTLNDNIAASQGGAIYVYYATVTVTNSTISGNTGFSHFGGGGGGIFNQYGYLTVNNSTIAGNSAYKGGGVYNNFGSLSVNNSIVSLNTSPGGSPQVFGSFSDNGFNFIGGDPLLGPLANNGGPTKTMKLLTGSPCINTGDPAFSGLQYDQRGAPYLRKGGPVIDIGAYEFQPISGESIHPIEGTPLDTAALLVGLGSADDDSDDVEIDLVSDLPGEA